MLDTLALLVILLAIILHYVLAVKFSINVPFSDDFDQQLGRFKNLHTDMWTLWQFLTVQHNEHRLLTTHGQTLVSVWLFGEINIKYQIWLSSLTLIALVCSFSLFVERHARLLVLAVAASFILLPNVSTVWLGGGLQYYAVMLYGILCLYTLQNIAKWPNFILSIFCYFLSLYSMASGVVLIIPAALMLIFCVNASFKTKILWLVGVAVITMMFFSGYQMSEGRPSLLYAFFHPVYSLQYTLLLLGNAFFGQFIGRPVQIMALVLLAYVTFKFARPNVIKVAMSNPLTYVVLFIAGVLALVVLGRVGGELWQTALSARYQVYVKSLWVSLFILMINLRLISKPLQMLCLACSVIYFLVGLDPSRRVLEEHQIKLSIGMSEMIFSRNPNGLIHGSNLTNTANITKTLMTERLYHPEFLESKRLQWSENVFQTNVVENNRGLISIEDKRFNEYRRILVNGDFNDAPLVVLRSAADAQKGLLFQSRKIIVGNGESSKYEVIIHEENNPLSDQIMVDVLGKTGGSDSLVRYSIGESSPIRLPGSMLKYAARKS